MTKTYEDSAERNTEEDLKGVNNNPTRKEAAPLINDGSCNNWKAKTQNKEAFALKETENAIIIADKISVSGEIIPFMHIESNADEVKVQSVNHKVTIRDHAERSFENENAILSSKVGAHLTSKGIHIEPLRKKPFENRLKIIFGIVTVLLMISIILLSILTKGENLAWEIPLIRRNRSLR